MTEVWGVLEKSQADPTTIDTAIGTAVTNHLADADAHLGASESLQSHKASEIIDHAAQSIIADKFKTQLFTSDILIFQFHSLDACDVVANFSELAVGSVDLRTSTVLNNVASLNTRESRYWKVDTGIDAYLEIPCFWITNVSPYNNCDGFLGWSFDGLDYIGFKVENGSIYAYCYDPGPDHTTKVLLNIGQVYNEKVFSMQLVVNDGVYFFVDGVQVAHITTDVSYDLGSNVLTVWVKNLSSGHYAEVSFGSFTFSPSLIIAPS